MHSGMRRLLEKLDLDWADDDLARSLHPFALGEFLGSGGTALVFAGCEREVGRPVVLKFPRVPEPEEVFRVGWKTCIDALDHEGAVLTRCTGIEGVVQLYEDRRTASLPHLVMERLGTSLDEQGGENGEHQLELRDAVALVRELVSTAVHMHSLGTLHGDITPRNVLRSSSSRWVLIDPAPPTLTTEDFSMRGVHGEQRDVLGIARTFLSAYFGVDNHTDVPEDETAELDDHPELLPLLRRMLGRSRYPIPAAQTVNRAIGRIWRSDFA